MPNLSWDLLWRDRGVVKGLRNVADAADNAEKRSKAFKVAVGVGLVAASAAAVKFGISSVKAYSEAQTAQNRLQDAFAKFPKLADTNISSLRNLNTALAQKTRFDDDATASGQAVLAQFKLTGQQITQLTPLLQDYAAKTGKDLPTAARDLGKAMLGQGRSLKAVGINFKDTGTQGGNFAQIMGGLRTQVGGFAEKEGKTAAGQAEILKNQFGELQESVGQALLPALLKVGGGLTKTVEFVGENSKVIGPLVGTVVGLSAAIWLTTKATRAWTVTQAVLGGLSTKAVTGLSALKVAFTGVELSAIGAGRAMKIAQLSIPVVGVALFAVTTALEVFASKSDTASDGANGFAESMKTVEGNVTRATAALNENVRAQAVNELQTKGAYEQAKLLGLSYGTVTDAALGNTAAIAEVNRVLGVNLALNPQLSKANSDNRNTAIGLSESLNGVALESIDATNAENVRRSAMIGGTGATNTLGAATKTAGEKAADAKRKIQDLAASMFEASRGALALSGSEISFQQAIDDATHAAKQNGRTLDTNTQKGRDNKTSLNNLVTASQAYITKLVATHASSKRVTAATKDARAEFIRVAEKMGVSATKAKELATKYFAIPKGVKTKVEQPGMTDAQRKTKDLDDKINGLNSKKVTVGITVNSTLSALNKAAVKEFGKGAFRASWATGGVLPGYTPGRDVHRFVSATGGQLELSGGEAVMRPEWTKAVGGPKAVAQMNAAARSGQGPGFADGGVVSRKITEAASIHGTTYNYGKLRDYAASATSAAIRAGVTAAVRIGTAAAVAAGVKAAKAAQAASASGGPIGSGGYASALRYARAHRGHPYVYASLWDCSGFMSALHSIILGQRPHRRYTTTAFHGAHAAGFTRGKSSPFRVGVRPLSGKLGHMAGTLNGVNVESAGGVGVRVGGGARGANSGMFSWRGGLAKGGVIGDLPFDLLDPQGERYQPELADLLHKAGYHRGGRVGGDGPERILSPRQNRAFEHLVRVMDRRGGGGVNYYVTINAPNYIGSQAELKQTLVSMARRGDLAVITR